MALLALDRKLLRDMTRMKGQAIAIGLVLAAGIAMFVAYLSNFDSLRRTQQAYYDRYRFADVFASCKRAPQRLDAALRSLPGVALVETRVAVDVPLAIDGSSEPVRGRIVSIPDTHRPALNDLFLRRGRWIEPGRPDEVIVNEGFALAHGLEPGDRFSAIINGRRQRLRVVGYGLSPEFIYVLAPGELIPDDSRYGIVWMERRALGAAFDMDGAFNDVALRVMPGASGDAVIDAVDRLLRPYGGLGAVPRRLQVSHWTLDSELTQLQTFGYIVPVVFLAVAAFLLNLAMARTLAVQRPQVAALKALGYTNRAIGWHYVKWGLAIALGGSLVGAGAGAWLGARMIALYNQYFKFPVLLYQLSGGVAAEALALGVAAAALGAVVAVRRAVRIPPAEAMRPEAPARYRTGLAERVAPGRVSLAARMVLRNLERHPWRTLTSCGGIACAVGLLLFGFAFRDVTGHLAWIQFSQAQRQDLTVTFVEPRAPAAVRGVAALRGVLAVEPVRQVPARLRAGPRSRQVVLTGQPPRSELTRIVDERGRVRAAHPYGLTLSSMLGRILDVGPGDRVVVEVLEGARPVRDVEVGALVDDLMGLSAYLDADVLHRMLREDRLASVVHAEVDARQLPALLTRLRESPVVAGVGLLAAVRQSFNEVMAQNLGLMTGFTVVFACIIAMGVVYNAARISLSERQRELASLRVLGFTIGEISVILLGELAVLTVAAIGPGLLLGWGFATALVEGIQSEFYRIPLVITPRSVAWASITILGASALSGLLVRRRLDHLDLIAVLKVRE